MNKIKYTFKNSIWQYDGPTAWYFVSLPQNISSEIREHLKFQEEGWGRTSAEAEIDGIKWKTAIWFNSKSQTHDLPLKAEIRKKANLIADQEIEVTIWL